MEQKEKIIQDFDGKITSDLVLFFDMDGTLLDTNLANFLSYNKAIQSVVNLNHNLTYNHNKRFNRSILKNVLPNLTDEEYEKIVHEKEEFYNDFLNEINIISETAEILIKYSKTNKTVLVTNCRKERAMKILKHFGLFDKFSNIFYREFGANGEKVNKFQNAILKLGIPPNLIIAFENEESEIADAYKSGITIINPTNL